MRLIFLLMAVFVVAGLGCGSIRTTPLDRSAGGHLSQDCEAPLKGVPVMLRVPTHLDVTIEEVAYWYPSKNGELGPVEMDDSLGTGRHVITEIKEIEKMFLVDPKRVASGSGRYGFSFAGQADDAGKGYLNGSSYEAVDTTLSQSAALARAVVANFKSANKNDLAVADEAGLVTTTRTVAYRKFDLNSPTIEGDVRAFCDLYLNGCQIGCADEPAYPQP